MTSAAQPRPQPIAAAPRPGGAAETAAEARLRPFVEHVPAAVAMLDRNLRYLACSRRWLTDYRLGDQDLTGRSHYEVFPEIPEHWKAIHRRCLAGAVERCEEEPFERQDGRTDWVRWEVRPWTDDDGTIGGLMLFTEVITERKLAEATLRESEEKYRDLVENLSEAIFSVDDRGVVTYMSPAIRTISQFGPEEVVGRSFAEFVHPDDLPAVAASLERTLQGAREPTEYRVRDKDGRSRWVRTFSRVVRDGERVVGLRGVLSDITEQHETEEAHRALVEHALQGLAIVQDDVICFANRAFEDITGEPLAALVGMPLFDWLEAYVHPDDRAGILAGVSSWRPGSGEVRRREFRVLHRDGGERWVLTITSELAYRGRPASQVLFADITERRHAEDALRTLNAELEARVRERTAQLEAMIGELEAFSYSVSHDLRAPLRAIDGFTHAVLEDCAGLLPAEAAADLGRVRAASQRMGELIDQLLLLSRVMRGDLDRGPVDLSGLAREIAAELQRTQPARRVRFAIADGLRTEGDAALLRAALANLLGNAWKFTAPRPAAHIEVGRRADGVYYVRDDGVGFEMEFADKLFRAFQRLHAPEEFGGSGIGLATVQRIVQRHGGRIWAESAPGRGATFFFTLGA